MYTKEQIINKFKLKHGDKYDYSNVEYLTMHDKVKIVCPIHGAFWQEPRSHINGQGCPMCGKIKRAKSKTDTIDSFISKAQKIHGNKYEYNNVEYINNVTKINVTCPKHGTFSIRPDMLLQGCGCPICKREKISMVNTRKNKILSEIISFINEIDNNIVYNYINNQEVYYPNHGIGIKILSLAKDNENYFPSRNYNLLLNKKYEGDGKQIIQIFEDEWLNKQNICKSRLRNIFNKSLNKVYARKCVVKEITNKLSKDFCSITHIQGSVNSSVNLGLFYNDDLVAVMAFGKLRKNLGSKQVENHYELLRFCTKHNLSVIGGASKLFSYFCKTYLPSEVISYADRRWSVGKLYQSIGFQFKRETEPNYFYIVDGVRKNRFSYRKDVLISKYGCLKEDTEHNFCKSQGWFRIYDCGCKVFVWNKK